MLRFDNNAKGITKLLRHLKRQEATLAVCDTCHKPLSVAQAVVMVVAGVTYVLCLDCTLPLLEDDDSVSVSMDLLRRLRDGVI